jgi:hypothetical protein
VSICTQWRICPFIIHFLLKVRIMGHCDVKLCDILVAQKHYLLQASISDLLKSCLEPDLAQAKKYIYIYSVYIYLQYSERLFFVICKCTTSKRMLNHHFYKLNHQIWNFWSQSRNLHGQEHHWKSQYFKFPVLSHWGYAKDCFVCY